MANNTVELLQIQFKQLADTIPDLYNNQLWTEIRQGLQHLSHNIKYQELLLETTTSISNLVSSISDVDQLLNRSVDLIKDNLGFSYVAIFLIDEKKSWLELKTSTILMNDLREPEQQRFRLEHDSNNIIQAVNDQQVHFFQEVESHPDLANLTESPDTISEIVIPLISKGQVIGALQMQSTDQYSSSVDNFHSFQILGDQLANAIQNAALFANADHQLEQLVTLHNINIHIAGILKIKTLLNKVAQLSTQLLRGDASIIRLVDPSQGIFEVNGIYNGSPDLKVGDIEKFGVGLNTIIFQEEQPLLVNDWPNNPLAVEYSNNYPDNVSAILNVPISLHDKIIGTIEVLSYVKQRIFSENDLHILSLLASQTAIAMQNTRLLGQIDNNRSFLKTIINHIPDPIFIKDKNHTWIEMNQANADVIGKPIQEIVGYTDQHFFPSALTNEFYRRDDEVFAANKIFQYEDKTVWSDGREHIAYTRLIPIPDATGQPKYLLGVTHDITERKTYEIERERFLTETAALYNISRQIAGALSERQVFEALFAQICLENPCEISALRFNTVQDEPIWAELKANWQQRDTHTHPIGTRIYLPDSSHTRLLTLNEPLFIENITSDARLSDAEREGFAANSAQSMAILPLIATGQELGVVLVYFSKPHTFSEITRRFWIAMIDQASVALSNRQLIQAAAYRAIQMETAAEVARAASLLNLDELLNAAVRLIRDRFHLYYTAIFLVDENKEWADLRAGTGVAGRIQLEKKHRLKVGGDSIIGWCISHKRPRIALDVGKDAIHFVNPTLPETRSELALPLIHRNQAIGALTVQSDEQAAFNREDILFLQTVADQLAHAIENARLFEIVTRAQAEAEINLKETLALQQLSQALSGTLQMNEILAIFFEAAIKELDLEFIQLCLVDEQQKHIKAVAGVGVSESNIKRANRSLDGKDILADIIRTGKTEIITGWDERFDKETFEIEGHADWVRIFIPITLRAKNIGVVEAGFNKGTLKRFETSQIRLLEAFISQTSLALDNAQRYEASQQRARREALIKEITTKVRASTNLDTILKTTIKEVGEAIGGKRTYIHLHSASETNGNTLSSPVRQSESINEVETRE